MTDERVQLRDDLIAAKALIDTPEKWGKGSPRPVGCKCAVDALTDAVFRPKGWEAFEASTAALKLHLPSRADHIAQFNDWPSTTHADIMALFDRAISKASTSIEEV